MITNTKICSKCRQEKGLELFRNQANGTYGKKAYCMECDDKSSKEHYLKNKDLRKLQIISWNSVNPEKVKEYKRNWAAKQSKSAQI